MQDRFGRALLGLTMAMLSAGLSAAFAQTTVAGTTPGQFSVNESGAATYSIPIQVPPGVAGMQPRLSLEYNSQGGNGLVGMGWSLNGLSAITRCPKTMAQDGALGGINFDMNDRFCLDGQRLMLVSGTYGVSGSEYRTELESFSRIIANGTAGNGPASFTVQTKAGLTMEMGNTADSRIEAQGKTTVRAWALNRIQDIKTNYLTVSYTEDAVEGGYYPARVDYTGSMGSSPSLEPFASVRFNYETRADIELGYQAGSVIRINKRLTNVGIFNGSTPIKDYRVSYDQGTATQRSRVLAIAECDGAGGCQAPTTLTMSDSSAGTFTFTGSLSIYPFWGSPIMADFNGDGKTDILINTNSENAGWYVYLSNGDGTFTYKSALSIYPFWGPPIIADFNGDGKADVMINTNSENAGWYVYLSNGDGTFTYKSTLSIYPFWGPPLMGDFNGDGKTDVIINTNSAGWYVYLSNGDGTFTHKGALTPWSFWGSPIVADFNGDGKTDILINTNSENAGWYVYVSNGDGTFTYKSALSIYPFWGPPIIADFNGDGRSDVLINTNSINAGWYAYLSPYGIPDSLTSLKEGGGRITVAVLKPLTDSTVYTKDTSPNAAVYPKIDLQYPQYVVSLVSTSNGVGGVNTVQYNYGGLKAEQGTGRGMLGFRWMKSKSVANNIESYTEFNQNWPFIGTVARNETRLAGSGNAGLLKRTVNTYAQSPGSAGATVFVYPGQSVEESWDLGGTPYPSTTSSYVYGQSPQYGDPTQITVSNSEGASKATVNEYWPADSNNWILGRLKKATVTSIKP